MLVYHNNYNSKYFIINILVNKQLNNNDLPNLIIDWIDESIRKYNMELNWNFGIDYSSIQDNLIKIFIYLDNKVYPYFDNKTLLITNDSYSTIDYNNYKFNIHKIKLCFNIKSDLLNLDENVIIKMGISGVHKHIILNELNILKYGNKFNNNNNIYNFIYLKNIKKNGKFELISCTHAYNNFINNLIKNT